MNLLVQARAQTPIAFRVGRDSRREETLDYVPGSALLGGLAAAHACLRPHQRDEFAVFFLQARVSYRNLYPARFSKPDRVANPLDADLAIVLPLPRTARSCKRFGGFRFHTTEDDDDRHGVWDSLLAWGAFSLSHEMEPARLAGLHNCSCGEPLNALPGFCRRGNLLGQWGVANVSKGMFTRTGVSRARAAAAEGVLYSREFLQEGSVFCGEWLVDDAIADDFQVFLEEVADGVLRVGHNRTRGLGSLGFPRLLPNNADTAAEIEIRASNFDAALRQAAGADARHAFYLPVTLTADCIWPDAAGRYRLQITADAIAVAWNLNGAELIYCNAVPRRVSGWNSLWGLPKADEWAIVMGSVFLFGLPAEPDWQALAQAQTTGLGIRRAEGFGAIRIADEFHVEVTGI